MTLWEIIFMLVILKIPIAYVGWVVWWAIKAEPEAGVEGGSEGIGWRPRRRRPPSPGRPGRALSRERLARSGMRSARRRARGSRVA